MHNKPDLLEWQILWIAENIPKGSMISDLWVLLDDRRMEVGIEIVYEMDGLEKYKQGFMN